MSTHLKVTAEKCCHQLFRRSRGVVVIQHDGSGGFCEITEFAISERDRSGLVGQERVFSRSHKGKALEHDILQRVVLDAKYLGSVQMQIASSQPAQIPAAAIVSAPNGHVGAKRNWRMHFCVGRLNQIAIEIEFPNVENVSWADNVQTGKRRVRIEGFLLVNNTQVIDAGLSSSCRWQEQEAQDCQKKPKTGTHGSAAVADGALHC